MLKIKTFKDGILIEDKEVIQKKDKPRATKHKSKKDLPLQEKDSSTSEETNPSS